ncbi:sigma-70 family RNA polymerase sigma factor [Ruminococcus sp.]|uniref:RNA polymerase sigma factor n=1 Tax=Ruminococcus sp. TaxID=41978 RepID=UPI0025E52334|nr:sigma-70 family RNA polymerase sigma factor [Ruminococcus sp.]MBQ8967262.1 sigma-70 family RNA polymerase sigma factor [Ruminococcus sp.]
MTDEQKDLEYVMEKYGRIVNGVIASMLGSPSEREDIFQEVFLLYYTKELYFEDEGARRSWLIRTAVNLCRAANRSPWFKFRNGEEFDPDTLVQPESSPESSELWQAVCRLKEKYRILVYLHYFEEIPLSEIAKTMKLSEGAVKMRLKRAREKLRTELESVRTNTERSVEADEREKEYIIHSPKA